VLVHVRRPIGQGLGLEHIRLGDLGQHADLPIAIAVAHFPGADVLGADQARQVEQRRLQIGGPPADRKVGGERQRGLCLGCPQRSG